MAHAPPSRKIAIRLLLLCAWIAAPLAGALAGAEPKRLAVLMGGSALVGVVIERELDRYHPLGPTHCGFCARPRDAVHRLLISEHGAAICDDCVEACSDLLRPAAPPTASGTRGPGDDPWQPPDA